jgi:hypothetical protein
MVQKQSKPELVLHNLLEQFILNPDDLEKIKIKIKQHAMGDLTSTQLKEYILQSRLTMLDNLKQLFPFYAQRQNANVNERNHEKNDINIKHNEDIAHLRQQIQEREELLNTLIPRIIALETALGNLKKKIKNILFQHN